MSPPSRAAGNGAGIALMFGAAFTFASVDALAKHLSDDFPTLQLVWFRFFFHVAFMLLVFGPVMRARLWRAANMRWQIGRGALLITTTVLSYTSLSLMPLAEFTAIAFVAPLVVTILAARFLGEKVGFARWCAVLAGFAGVLVIIRPGGALFGWQALVPLAMATIYAVFQILTRKFAGADDPVTTLFFTGLTGAVIASLLVPFAWKTPSVDEWPLLACLGLLGGGGHLLLILAFQRVPASALAPISYMQLVFATVLGIVVAHHVPDRLTLIGMGLIALAGLFGAALQGLASRRPRPPDEADIPISD